MTQHKNFAEGTAEDFAKAADLVEQLGKCETNGSYLALILTYRREVLEAFHLQERKAKEEQSKMLDDIVKRFNSLSPEEKRAELEKAGQSDWGRALSPLFPDPEPQPEVTFDDLIGFNIYTNWRIKGCGFGQTHASLSSKGNKVLMSMSPEGMGVETIRSILHTAVDAYIDKIDPEVFAKDRYSFRQEVDLPPDEGLIENPPEPDHGTQKDN